MTWARGNGVVEVPEPDERSPTRSARRRAREFVLQGIYQWLVAQTDPGAIERQLLAMADYAKADGGLCKMMLHGVIQESAGLHEAITPFIDRPLAQLSPVEHSAILMGAWELAHAPETPYRVVINEAVEITKSFGGTDGHRYVNGVLDKLAASLRPTERPHGRV
jgi:N utilization substance protein B